MSPGADGKYSPALAFKVQLGGWCVLVPKAPEFSRTASGFNGLYFRSYMTYQRNYFSELLTDWFPGHTATT